jgi:predicted Zn-dependent protease
VQNRFWFGLALAIAILIGLAHPGFSQNLALPPLKTYPLPPLLAQWPGDRQAGDYFDRIQPTAVGYLLWSQFPIQVYIEPPPDECQHRFSGWLNAILAAVDEWNEYLPLAVTQRPENANIIWQCQRPPLRATLNRDRQQFEFPVARNAEARYHLYRLSGDPERLAHRFTIQLSPHQSDADTLATARHELGHALGIWGHSPTETDALYAEQTRLLAPISARDVNTLKRVYQQPTRLSPPRPSP